MDVAEANELPRPAELELTFQRNGVWLAAERTSRLATRKEPEAEGCPIMDDPASDGRGARMESEGAGVRAVSQSWPSSLVLVNSPKEVTYG